MDINSKSNITKNIKLGILTFIVMNTITVLSPRGFAPEAMYGLTSVFYYIFAAICFLIPVSLVSAELATGWPQKGGVFNWVSAAFGKQVGFIAIYLQWLATTICFPTMLIFIAVSIAFIDVKHANLLSTNKYYTLSIILFFYWFSVFTTSKGVKSAAKIGSIAGIIGTIIPLAILFISGIAYVYLKGTIDFTISSQKLFPNILHFHNLVLAASVFLFYSGMEINAVHVQSMNNPLKNYPISVGIAASLVVICHIIGTLLISAIIPHNQINIVNSLFTTYDTIFKYFHISWMGEIITAAIAVGAFAQITVIIAGPSTGLFQVGKKGYLPPKLQKSNQHGVQMPLLYLQGAIVTTLSFLLIILPSVQSTFQILGQLASILYLIMYLLLFSSAIYLRYKEPNINRPYKVPFGNVGMWIIGSLGFISSLLALCLSFIPPGQFNTGSTLLYIAILITLTTLFLLVPILIYKNKKSSWLIEKAN